jgi:hypothetical protein
MVLLHGLFSKHEQGVTEMDIVVQAVKKLEVLLEHGGCTESGVLLDVDPDAVNCQFEKGACMTATFGGKCGVYTTFDPIRARTKISFMFDAPLDTPPARGAACAIINVAAGFFCLARVLRPCKQLSHPPCMRKLTEEISGKQVSCIGSASGFKAMSAIHFLEEPSQAEIILINGEGIIGTGIGEAIEKYRTSKRIICIGPSVAGIARLYDLEHWCPYGSS